MCSGKNENAVLTKVNWMEAKRQCYALSICATKSDTAPMLAFRSAGHSLWRCIPSSNWCSFSGAGVVHVRSTTRIELIAGHSIHKWLLLSTFLPASSKLTCADIEWTLKLITCKTIERLSLAENQTAKMAIPFPTCSSYCCLQTVSSILCMLWKPYTKALFIIKTHIHSEYLPFWACFLELHLLIDSESSAGTASSLGWYSWWCCPTLEAFSISFYISTQCSSCWAPTAILHFFLAAISTRQTCAWTYSSLIAREKCRLGHSKTYSCWPVANCFFCLNFYLCYWLVGRLLSEQYSFSKSVRQ